ncbi:hypothetical protein [uncultured Kiloniella sp.]|uniref:hypothetical protein n=1 Tax=uncultured Kiloniella sp. TaxID=1133091 RepID=UPI00262C6978|nr:hypothetical protein [uncultured Kiloniella sp.]
MPKTTDINTRVEFDIVAMREPNTLLRILEYFALIGATPSNVKADATSDGTQTISIIVEGVSEQRAYILAGKINEIFTVNSTSYVIEPIKTSVGKTNHPDMLMCA